MRFCRRFLSGCCSVVSPLRFVMAQGWAEGNNSTEARVMAHRIISNDDYAGQVGHVRTILLAGAQYNLSTFAEADLSDCALERLWGSKTHS
jgi:hypothetical protein